MDTYPTGAMCDLIGSPANLRPSLLSAGWRWEWDLDAWIPPYPGAAAPVVAWSLDWMGAE